MLEAVEYLKTHGHPNVLDYSPREIIGWHRLAMRRRRQEIREGITIVRLALAESAELKKALAELGD